MSFWQLFSSYMYEVKAAETTFVRKIRTFNIDEIDTRSTVKFLRYVFEFIEPSEVAV